MKNAKETVTEARVAFNSGVTKPFEFRLKQLKNFLRLVEENDDSLAVAIMEDTRKSKFEAVLYEVELVKNSLRNMIYNLKEWMEPVKPGKPLPFLFDNVLIYPEPYGVALVIGAWNYPLTLTLIPVAGALAAGNTVVLKPSELAPKSARILDELFPKYLDTSCYHIINGGIPETTELLEQRFDYIFYTGGSQVGKIVHQAANKYLTPTTLELGGKSPVYIDKSANIDIAASRILFGKMVNSGQSCIAPDYILCSKDIQQDFIESCRKLIKKWYAGDIKHSIDFGRIINERHFQRIVKLLHGTNIALGGSYDINDRFIEPTIITEVTEFDPIMQEEIFGPVLPILNVTDTQQAMDFINSKEKPLVIYLFSTNKKTQELFLKHTSSGNLLINDTMVHYSCESIPFGGVGNSGMGSYQGKFTFDTFSHQKGTIIRSLGKISESLQKVRYPPYTKDNMKLIAKAMKKSPPIPGYKYISVIAIFLLGVLMGLFIKLLLNVK